MEIFIKRCKHYTKMLKITTKQRKKKRWDNYPRTTIPTMNEWKILIPALIYDANQSKEYYIALISSCNKVMSPYPIK